MAKEQSPGNQLSLNQPTFMLTQQVLNGQIGSLKSSEFQKNFNPQKRKSAIFLCGPRQLILNSRQRSQNMKNG